jgi:two-component system NtrC family sensor kinase
VTRSEYRQVADVVMRCDPSLPLVTCVPGKLNQVFLNLIINATQAIRAARCGEARGTITISSSVSATPGWVEIRIHDSGPGIPEAVRPRLFEPFFTTKPVGEGTGQGLFLSREIVKGHGGTLTFESDAATGTTFIVTLPIG